MRSFLTPMQRALCRVINNSGLVSDPEPNSSMNPVAVCKAWESAKTKGFLRRMTAHELECVLHTKRSVRAVILATLQDAAMDERRDPYWTQPKPSVRDCTEALESVTEDIFQLNASPSACSVYWTLTESGIASLSETTQTQGSPDGETPQAEKEAQP